jgi:hypothetical protein
MDDRGRSRHAISSMFPLRVVRRPSSFVGSRYGDIGGSNLTQTFECQVGLRAVIRAETGRPSGMLSQVVPSAGETSTSVKPAFFSPSA